MGYLLRGEELVKDRVFCCILFHLIRQDGTVQEETGFPLNYDNNIQINHVIAAICDSCLRGLHSERSKTLFPLCGFVEVLAAL